jgi:hypothetical protein
VIALTSAFGCGSDGSSSRPPDAAPSVPDAAVCDLMMCGDDCVDTSTNTDHCGGCFQPCTPAQDCEQTCQCPTIAFAAGDFILSQMDTDMLAPTILGIGLYSDADVVDALVVGFADPDTPTGTDIALAVDADTPFVAIGYDIDTGTREFRGALRAQSGTLNLTRRCAAGVAGTVTGASFIEVDPQSDPPVVLADGCLADIESLAFDFGDPCE